MMTAVVATVVAGGGVDSAEDVTALYLLQATAPVTSKVANAIVIMFFMVL
jgi:hypothetical protein